MPGQIPSGDAASGAALAVLRFPRGRPGAKGRHGVVTLTGAPFLSLVVSRGGRQVDVEAAGGAPVGRILAGGRGRWELVAPHTGQILAAAETRHGTGVSIGGGPWADVDGRGDAWDLVWQDHPLLAVRRTPRRVAKRLLDVWVMDPVCTPPVVAFVVHVRRMWQATQDETTALLLQQQQQSTAITQMINTQNG